MAWTDDWFKARMLLVSGAILAVAAGLVLVSADPPANEPSAEGESGPWREEKRVEAHDGAVTNLAFNSDGSRLASVGYDKKVRLWKFPEQKLLRTRRTMSVGAVFSPDLTSAAVARTTIELFDLSSHRVPRKFGEIHTLAYSPDGEILAVGESLVTGSGGDGKIRLYRVSDGMPLRTLDGHQRYVMRLAFCPQGKFLASAGGDATVQLWSVSDGRLLHHREKTGRVGSLAFSPNGKLLAGGGLEGGGLYIWQLPELNPLHKWHWNPVSDLAFSPNGKLLAVCSSSDNVPFASLHLLSVSDGREVQTLVDEKAAARCVAFNPEGKLLATGLTDGTIRFFSPTKE